MVDAPCCLLSCIVVRRRSALFAVVSRRALLFVVRCRCALLFALVCCGLLSCDVVVD